MTYFLRSIRQARWLKYPDLNWLPHGELQGDALRDLQTTDNALSIYKVESEGDKERIVIGLAATKDNVANLDYAIFEDSKFSVLGIAAEEREGDTPDIEVNKLHCELRNLTVGLLAQLAQVVSMGKHNRILKKQIKSGLQAAVNAGMVDRGRLKPQLLKELNL